MAKLNFPDPIIKIIADQASFNRFLTYLYRLWNDMDDGTISWTNQSILNNLTLLNLTQGSVLFIGASGLVSQKNANFFWDNTNFRLGIGKTNPGTPLDVNGTITATGEALNGTLTVTAGNIVMATSGQIQILDGTVGAPGLACVADGSLGFYRIGVTDLGLSMSGTLRMEWTSTQVSILNPLTMNSNKITSLANGSAATDAATFGQIPARTARTRRVFTATGSNTYTTPAGVLYLFVRMVGGGGGGEGSGTAARGAGGNGVNSTFGASLTCTGGIGGTDATSQTGSGASGGDVNISGGGAAGATSALALVDGASGGGTPFGSGGWGGIANVAGGAASSGTGAGGGGGGGVTGGAAGAGGSGAGYLEKIITSPAASYNYVVGAQGAAGSAGTGGVAGGAGGSGIIIVDEFYN